MKFAIIYFHFELKWDTYIHILKRISTLVPSYKI